MNINYDNYIHTPCRVIFAGPSGCGKSELVHTILKRSEIFYPPLPKKIKYFYKESLPIQHNPQIEYINAKPTSDDIEDNSICIIDDWMTSVGKADLLTLFTVYSRHRNISVFLLVQNFFFKSLRELTLNASHIVLFKSPRDSSFVNYLARQMFPNDKHYLTSAYAHATIKPHSYLLINTTQHQVEDHRLSSSFLPERAIIYLPLP